MTAMKDIVCKKDLKSVKKRLGALANDVAASHEQTEIQLDQFRQRERETSAILQCLLELSDVANNFTDVIKNFEQVMTQFGTVQSNVNALCGGQQANVNSVDCVVT